MLGGGARDSQRGKSGQNSKLFQGAASRVYSRAGLSQYALSREVSTSKRVLVPHTLRVTIGCRSGKSVIVEVILHRANDGCAHLRLAAASANGDKVPVIQRNSGPCSLGVSEKSCAA